MIPDKDEVPGSNPGGPTDGGPALAELSMYPIAFRKPDETAGQRADMVIIVCPCVILRDVSDPILSSTPHNRFDRACTPWRPRTQGSEHFLLRRGVTIEAQGSNCRVPSFRARRGSRSAHWTRSLDSSASRTIGAAYESRCPPVSGGGSVFSLCFLPLGANLYLPVPLSAVGP